MAAQPGGAGTWQPEADPDYGQALLRFILWRLRHLLLGGVVLGGLIAIVASLYMLPEFSAKATILVDKKGAASASIGAAAALLGMGTGDSNIENEIQIITSRGLASEVVRDLALGADVIDPHSPDAPLGRLDKLLGRNRGFTRAEVYSRLTISDLAVNPDMLKLKKLWLTTDSSGWHCAGKSGADGAPVDLGSIRFTPHFGKAHQPGYKYLLKISPEREALDVFKGRLSAAPVNDNTTVLGVGFQHHNPFICKAVVDSVVSKYLERYQSKLTGDYDALLRYVESEQERVTRQLNAALDERRAYQEESQVYSPLDQGRVSVEAIAALSAQRTEQDILLQQAQALLGILDSRTPDEVYEALKNPRMSEQLEGESGELGSLVQALRVERQTKTEEHPDVQRLQTQIKGAIGQLRQAALVKRRQAQTSISELAADIAQYRGELQKLPGATGKLAVLNGEIESGTDILTLLEHTAADTKLQRQQTVREIQLLDPALLPGERDSPRLGFNAVLGAILGFLLMFPLGLLLETRQQRIVTLREIRGGLGLPVVAVLTRRSGRTGWRPAEPQAAAADVLARLLRLLAGERPPAVPGQPGLVVGVVSAVGAPADFELAWGLAGAGPKPTLLIEADPVDDALRRAAAPGRERPGLAEVLAGSAQLDDVLLELPGGRQLLPAGLSGAGAAPEAAAALLAQLRERFGLVVLCLPTPLRWPARQPLADLADSLLLSAPQNGVDRSELAGVVGDLARRGLAIRGVVVTGYRASDDSLGSAALRLVTLR